jgi:hypothetical protein
MTQSSEKHTYKKGQANDRQAVADQDDNTTEARPAPDPTPTIGGIALTDLVVTSDSLKGETISIVPIYKVRKPKRHEFFRVHPDSEDGTNDYQMAMLLYISDEEMEKVHYLVTPGLIDYFNGAVRTCSVRLAMSRVGGKPEGAPFILVTTIPEEGSGENLWVVSMQAAAEEAKLGWIKACSNKDTGAYDIVKPVDPNAMPEPKWPTTPFPEILEKVFEGRIVSDPDHEIIRKLTGAM